MKKLIRAIIEYNENTDKWEVTLYFTYNTVACYFFDTLLEAIVCIRENETVRDEVLA